MHLKRVILILCLGLLFIACGLGAFIILKNRYGLHSDHWVEYVMAAAVISVPALAAAHLREKGVWRKPMLVVIGLCVFALLAVGMIELFPARRSSWTHWRHGGAWLGGHALYAIWLSAIWAIALLTIAVVSIPKLRGWASVPKVTAFAAIIVMGLAASQWAYIDVYHRYNDVEQEVFAGVMIVALLTIIASVMSMAIMGKLNGLYQASEFTSATSGIELVCPRCLLPQAVIEGESHCLRCKLRFEIKIGEPRCPRCDYLLHGLTEPGCPECGYLRGDDEVVKHNTQPSA